MHLCTWQVAEEAAELLDDPQARTLRVKRPHQNSEQYEGKPQQG